MSKKVVAQRAEIIDGQVVVISIGKTRVAKGAVMDSKYTAKNKSK